MAGSIALSLTQQLDQFGVPLAGGRLYFIQAGTVSTPQNAFQDSALTLPWPNPMILSASGRVGQLFFADGSIKIRLTDVNGVEILVADGILVVGASSGGGGGSPVDATTVFQTGDLKPRYGTGIHTGWVRCNARTIGSATSGASERANSDTQALFEYLWNTDAGLTVSTGRGGSSAADWAANKNIAIPDYRGRVIAGFDDMGNSAASRLTVATMSGTGIGSVSSAAETKTILTANLPAYTPTGTVVMNTLGLRTRSGGPTTSNDITSLFEANNGQALSAPNNAPYNSSSLTFTGVAQGGSSTAFPIVQPTGLATFYLKL